MTTIPFDDVVTSLDQLRTLYRPPQGLATQKKIDHLDAGAQSIIATAPFVLIATADTDGRCDVSPRGGPPGFVKVLDEHRLAIPDLNGNNLLDSLSNLVLNTRVGLLFVLPGRDETLRVEGRAWVSTSDALLDLFTNELRRPVTAIGIEVEAAYIHCAKAFRRGRVWDAASWADLIAPSAIEVLRCQLQIETPLDELASTLEESYIADLARDRPS